MDISIKDNIAPSFYDVHSLITEGAYSQYWFSGGRGSTKSSFIAIQIIIGIMENPEANAICFRKYSNTIRNSLYSTLLWAIEILGVEHKFKGTVAPFEITYRETGQKIILLGLDDPQKIKSIRVKKGYFKILWFEELPEFDGMEEIRSVQQSVLRGGEEFVEFLSYNPPRDPQAWVNKEKEAVNDKRYLHHSTYLDVDPSWLGARFIEDAERLKETDDDLYQCEYMGLAIGLSDSVIFNGKYVIQPFEPEEWWSPVFGADWGFANDPSVLLKAWIGPHDDYGDNCLYIEYAEFGYRVDTPDLPDMYDKVPGSKKYRIRADNARPETISQMVGLGYQVVAADKWPGSIEDGIAFIRSFDKIIIHTRCEEMAEEARLYSYKIDKITKDILPVTVDKFNHCFVGETIITTNRGGIPIKDIKKGDMVLTRNGYRNVVDAFDNGFKPVKTYKLLNGKSLTCTDTHSIITKGGKAEIKNLSKQDVVYYEVPGCKFIETENQKLPYIMKKNIADILKAKDDLIGFILKGVRREGKTSTYIFRFIWIVLVKFQMIIMFIMMIITPSIMNLIIYVLYQFQNTCLNIARIISKIIGVRLKNTLLLSMKNLRLGIKAMRAESGIKNTIRRIKMHFIKKQNIYAHSVNKNMLDKKGINQAIIVQINVNQHIEGNPALIILKKVVLCVAKNFLLINIEKQNAVQKNVRRVYDLSIEGKHEYVANGLLVSNSWDSVRYALSQMIKKRMIGFTEKQKRDNNRRVKTTIAPAMDEQPW